MCLMEKFVNVEICKCRQKSCQSYSQYLKLQTKSILDKMNICLRKTKKNPKTKKSIGWLFKKIQTIFKIYEDWMKDFVFSVMFVDLLLTGNKPKR